MLVRRRKQRLVFVPDLRTKLQMLKVTERDINPFSSRSRQNTERERKRERDRERGEGER